ncbi:hypothetical protein HS961_02970 [Comamonas piscis]|uniref:Uncharacterized protein n=1 Tax=Comamonas piscis TaxID=1562974 RepID=A0A7G5ED03_9BURK|nr:hypothetical protein [Comamonas piscis]QMV71878.1 hypothetical protein HS961_02970 [Comamonas piscis]WSO34614.1 hypothetical protein VUJ63_02990 [Comamonas piscis]
MSAPLSLPGLLSASKGMVPSALTTTLVMPMAACAGAANTQKPARASKVGAIAEMRGAARLGVAASGALSAEGDAPGLSKLMQFFIITTPSIENINISEF